MIEQMQKAISMLKDGQVSRAPSNILRLLCEELEENGEIQKASRLALWHKLFIEEAEKRNISICV